MVVRTWTAISGGFDLGINLKYQDFPTDGWTNIENDGTYCLTKRTLQCIWRSSKFGWQTVTEGAVVVAFDACLAAESVDEEDMRDHSHWVAKMARLPSQSGTTLLQPDCMVWTTLRVTQ